MKSRENRQDLFAYTLHFLSKNIFFQSKISLYFPIFYTEIYIHDIGSNSLFLSWNTNRQLLQIHYILFDKFFI
jgi:hypothetical protein